SARGTALVTGPSTETCHAIVLCLAKNYDIATNYLPPAGAPKAQIENKGRKSAFSARKPLIKPSRTRFEFTRDKDAKGPLVVSYHSIDPGSPRSIALGTGASTKTGRAVVLRNVAKKFDTAVNDLPRLGAPNAQIENNGRNSAVVDGNPLTESSLATLQPTSDTYMH
ncbi:hypothetical protein C0992_011461, partial [Termitomyces sp. T32_za158]